MAEGVIMINEMTYGEWLFYGGLICVISGVIFLIVGSIIYKVKRKRLKKQLMDEYGF